MFSLLSVLPYDRNIGTLGEEVSQLLHNYFTISCQLFRQHGTTGHACIPAALLPAVSSRPGHGTVVARDAGDSPATEDLCGVGLRIPDIPTYGTEVSKEQGAGSTEQGAGSREQGDGLTALRQAVSLTRKI